MMCLIPTFFLPFHPFLCRKRYIQLVAFFGKALYVNLCYDTRNIQLRFLDIVCSKFFAEKYIAIQTNMVVFQMDIDIIVCCIISKLH